MTDTPVEVLIDQFYRQLQEKYGDGWEQHKPSMFLVAANGWLMRFQTDDIDPLEDLRRTLGVKKLRQCNVGRLTYWLPVPTPKDGYFNLDASLAVGREVRGIVGVTDGSLLSREQWAEKLNAQFELEVTERQPPAPDFGL